MKGGGGESVEGTMLNKQPIVFNEFYTALDVSLYDFISRMYIHVQVISVHVHLETVIKRGALQIGM